MYKLYCTAESQVVESKLMDKSIQSSDANNKMNPCRFNGQPGGGLREVSKVEKI